MKLKSLKLTNFQGVGNFVLDANLKDCAIMGANAAGKTTIFSAFCFLLYGLDSQGKTFLPKPVDGSGEPKHGISSEAEAIFLLNGDNEITLKKEFKELWVKKHGSPKKVFTRHTVKHFWDSVPISEKEYKKRLSEIAPESVFKLLTSTRYFSESLHWQERRQILLNICGDISDTDKTLEDQKKIITAQKTKLNKELNELPVRIDEVSKGQPDISGLDLSAIEKELSEIAKALIGKNEEAARIESGGEIAEKIKKQREIESELLEIENRITKERNRLEKIQRKQISDLEIAQEAEESARDRTMKGIKGREATNKIAEQDMSAWREKWNKVNESVFDESSIICPTCGQEYPHNQAQNIKETFHTKKAETLANINQTGKKIGAEIIERKDLNETDMADVSLYEEKIEELTERIGKLQTAETPAEKNKRQEVLELDLTELKLNIEGLRSNSQEEAKKVKAEIDTLHDKRILAETRMLVIETHKKGQARIVELGNQQRVVAKEYENLEADLYIMDLFIREKVKLLEDKVNSKFKLARFKLFEVQVNSALNEICEVTYGGIGWNSGLNHASKVNLGIDICNTLSKHFNLTMPLFLDDMNLVTKTIPSNAQLIKLFVDKNSPKLTVV